MSGPASPEGHRQHRRCDELAAAIQRTASWNWASLGSLAGLAAAAPDREPSPVAWVLSGKEPGQGSEHHILFRRAQWAVIQAFSAAPAEALGFEPGPFRRGRAWRETGSVESSSMQSWEPRPKDAAAPSKSILPTRPIRRRRWNDACKLSARAKRRSDAPGARVRRNGAPLAQSSSREEGAAMDGQRRQPPAKEARSGDDGTNLIREKQIESVVDVAWH